MVKQSNLSLFEASGSAFLWRALERAGTHGIVLARSLILARLLFPEDFGLLAISFAAVEFMGSVSDVGLTKALVHHEDPGKQEYDAAWSLGFLRGLTIATLLVLSAPLIAEAFAEPRAIDLIRLSAFRPLLAGLASAELVRLVRQLNFRRLAILRCSGALANAGVAIALAQSWGVWALIAGNLVDTGLYVILSYLLAPYRPRFQWRKKFTGPLLGYGRWILLTSILKMTGLYVLQIAISRRLGVEALGLYFVSARLALFPFELAGEVVGPVIFPIFARVRAEAREARRTFRATLIVLSAFLIPGSFMIIALAPSLVENILGQRWEGTAFLIQLWACVGLLGVISEVLVPLLLGIGEPGKVTLLESVRATLSVSLVWVFTGFFGVAGAVGARAVSALFVNALCIPLAQGILSRPFSQLGLPVLTLALASASGAASGFLVDYFLGGVVGFFVACPVAVSIVLALLAFLDRSLEIGLVQRLSWFFPRFREVFSGDR